MSHNKRKEFRANISNEVVETPEVETPVLEENPVEEPVEAPVAEEVVEQPVEVPKVEETKTPEVVEEVEAPIPESIVEEPKSEPVEKTEKEIPAPVLTVKHVGLKCAIKPGVDKTMGGKPVTDEMRNLDLRIQAVRPDRIVVGTKDMKSKFGFGLNEIILK